MDNLNVIIAKRLCELRKENNLTQAQVAEKLNYSDKAVSKWEKGDSIPSVEILKKMSELYGSSIGYIVGEVDAAPKTNSKGKNLRRLCITLLSVVAVWAAVLVCYDCFDLAADIKLWQLFCWAVPLSFADVIVFDAIWNKHRLLYIFASLLCWSVLVCLSVQFWHHNIWQILLIGIPLQIAIFCGQRL